MLYNLYKSIYSLSRKNKEFLHHSFNDIVASIQREENKERIVVARTKKEAKIIDAKNNVFKQVVAGGLHDPETPEEMCKLIDLLEKFVEIDNNISHDNISIFINPMSMGSKKVMIRPCRIVGLMRKLDRLSRRYKKEMCSEESDLSEISNSFKNNLGEIKSRLTGMRAKIKKKKIR